MDYTDYDAHGRYVNRTDASGTIATYAYDKLNRVTGVTYDPAAGVTGATKAFTYDGLSRLVNAEDDDSTVTFHYDSLSNVLEETLIFKSDNDTYTTASMFDGVGNRTSLTYPVGSRTIVETYDDLNRLSTIVESATTIAEYKYNGPFLLEQRDILPGGIPAYKTRTTYTFENDLRRIQNITHGTVSSDFFDQSYTWDAVGNKTQRALTGGTTYDYTYDLLNRMTQSVKTPDA